MLIKKLDLVSDHHPVGAQYELFPTAFDLLVGGASLLLATVLKAEAAGIATRFSSTQIEHFIQDVLEKAVHGQSRHVIDTDDADGLQQELLVASTSSMIARFVEEQAEVKLNLTSGAPRGYHNGDLADLCERLRKLFNGPSEGQVQRTPAAPA